MSDARSDIARRDAELWERRSLNSANLFNFGSTDTVPMGFLDNFNFPATGAIAIGARTGGGKTSALVNVAREYRTSGRTVAFVTYEMNAQEIGLALALSYYAERHTTPITGWIRNDPGPGTRTENLGELEASLPPLPPDADADFVDLFSRVKAYIAENGSPPEPLKPDYERLGEELTEGKLAILDALGDIGRLGRYIEGTDFSAYVIDYIQVIPAEDNFGRDSYKGTQAVCDRFRELVNAKKKLLIFGAQFNRTAGDEDDRASFDPRVDQFREAADIEQVSTLALGIGYQVNQGGRREFFYKILKNRFAGRMNGAKLASAGFFEFYFAQRGGRWTPGERWVKSKPPKKLGENQQIIFDALAAAPFGKSLEELKDVFEEHGKRRDNARQTIDPLLLAAKIELIDGLYHLKE